MYIPIWLILIITIVIFLMWRSKGRRIPDLGNPERTAPVEDTRLDGSEGKENNDASADDIKTSIEGIENGVSIYKESLFHPEIDLFDSPEFIDYQNSFNVMEINYLRLKQRFFHIPERAIEIAKDWFRYVEALAHLKNADLILNVDLSEYARDNFEETSKEPSIIKDEIEKKFKSLLGDDWRKIPPDYWERLRVAAKKSNKDVELMHLEMRGDNWKKLYSDSWNLFKSEEKRRKQEKEQEIKSGGKQNKKHE